MRGLIKWPLSCMIMFLMAIMIGGTEGFVGINWSRRASQRLIPSVVVDLLLRNGIKEAKIFSPGDQLGLPFANSGITISITLRQDRFWEINSTMDAVAWVEDHCTKLTDLNITLRYVMIGNGPFSPSKGRAFFKAADILENMSEALQKSSKHNHMKASIRHLADILKTVQKPSECEFLDEVKEVMAKTVETHKKYNAPFSMDFMPLLLAKRMNATEEFGFMDNKSNFTVVDNGTVYTNAFEFWYDACVWALRKLGAPDDLPIIVGKISWPTDGCVGATPENSSRFFKGFLEHIRAGKGTPIRKGPIDVYLHSVVDENQIEGRTCERHQGLYTFDGRPKFPIDLSGEGRSVMPVSAIGIDNMPDRFCIYNGNNESPEKVRKWFEYVCQKADCSSLEEGGSCSNLNATWKISYAFNMYYQMMGQSTSNCTFEGLGTVVTREHDPSTESCKFLLEIISAEQVDGGQSIKLQAVAEQEDAATLNHISITNILLALLFYFFVFVR